MSKMPEQYSEGWARSLLSEFSSIYPTGTKFCMRSYAIPQEFLVRILQRKDPDGQKAWRRWKNLVKIVDFVLMHAKEGEESARNVLASFRRPKVKAMWSTKDVREDQVDIWAKTYSQAAAGVPLTGVYPPKAEKNIR